MNQRATRRERLTVELYTGLGYRDDEVSIGAPDVVAVRRRQKASAASSHRPIDGAMAGCGGGTRRHLAEKCGFIHAGVPREDPTGVLMEWQVPRDR